MNLKNLTIEVRDAMYEAMKGAIYNGESYACATVNTDNGYIDLYLSKNGDVDAVVSHDEPTRRKDSHNIELFIENVLRGMDSWQMVEKEVEAENAETPEQEYARRGETMFERSMQWHRM